MKFKNIEWQGNDPTGIMQSYTTLFNNITVGFRIMNGVKGLCLVDFNKDNFNHEYILIKSVNEGKVIAQERFNVICSKIINNISQ